MCIDADNDQLVALQRLHPRIQVAALKGAVAPLRQHHVPLDGRNFCYHGLLGRIGLRQARAPHVVEQRTVGCWLIVRLCRVENRNAMRRGPALQRGNVADERLQQPGVGFIEAKEIALHVVDEQRCA